MTDRPDPAWVRAAFARFDATAVSADMAVVTTADLDLVRFPEHLRSPTFGTVQVWSHSTRPLRELLVEVADVAARWDVTDVWWWTDDTTPPGTVDALVERGATLCDEYLLLAADLTGARHEALDVDDPRTLPVDNRERFDAALRVRTEGWRREPPDAATADAEYRRTLDDLRSGRGRTVLGMIEDVAASVGDVRVLDDVGRLFGAVTLPAYRRRGLYGAVVAVRLRYAAERDARWALTRARPGTSAPLLARRGFACCGHERCYRVAVTPTP